MPVELPSTISEAGEWLRSRRASSVELTRAFLERARAAQETLSAFMTFTEPGALAAAARADQELASGQDRGPLQGIPLGIKDILATSDAPTTANSRVLDPAWGQRDDATVVRKLREHGAVIIGKLVMIEFAIGSPDEETGMPFARNPWDVARLPGGSSSGTGAAVAAGLVLGGLGTDTGGSIRGPASFCGISGLKPTFGRVSKEGCVPLGFSLDHIGPMARTMRDCALLLQPLAGADPLDPCTVSAPVPDYVSGLTGSLDGVRIGVPREFFFDHPQVEPEVGAAVSRGIEQMQAAGAIVRDVPLRYAAMARVAQRVIMLGEAYAYHLPDLRHRSHLYSKHTRRVLEEGALYSAADYVQAQLARSVIRQHVTQVMADVDVLITPTTWGVAPLCDGADPDATRHAPSFTAMWNLTGQPAASVCCGFTPGGLPIGLQIIGKPFDEATVLRVGDAYQHISDWHTRTPATVREVQTA
jgi:aspartyl-tRNA(Asn)/glutamyl-tRNA(Gln) amidotransferase subunit A